MFSEIKAIKVLSNINMLYSNLSIQFNEKVIKKIDIGDEMGFTITFLSSFK